MSAPGYADDRRISVPVLKLDGRWIANPLVVTDRMVDEFGIDHARYLQAMDGAAGEHDEDVATYMSGRRVYSAGLEDMFQTTPFEVFPIMRGQRVGRAVSRAGLTS